MRIKKKERSTQNVSFDNETVKKKRNQNLRNIIGIFFAVTGFIGFFATPDKVYAMCVCLMGVTLTTYFGSFLVSRGINLKKWQRIVICIACFFGLGISSPESTETEPVVTETPVIVETVEPTIQPTIEPTVIPTATPTVIATPEVEPTATPDSVEANTAEQLTPINPLFEGYTLIDSEACNLSGSRTPNAVVDVGYGDREYWAFTNEHGQLVKVVAAEIILQNESSESVTSEGRYCQDEAKVPGTESSDLDEGHVIADSLGGVSNAYNITPQDSVLNRHGDQAYMEKTIRDAGGATDFVAEITYPDTTTMIPSHYKYTYTVWGDVIVDEFDNVNPETTIKQENVNSSGVGYTGEGASNSGNSAPVVPVAPQEPTYQEPVTESYVLNNNTYKFHRPSCNSVKKIKPENKGTHNGTKDELISWGYSPCKKCNP